MCCICRRSANRARMTALMKSNLPSSVSWMPEPSRACGSPSPWQLRWWLSPRRTAKNWTCSPLLASWSGGLDLRLKLPPTPKKAASVPTRITKASLLKQVYGLDHATLITLARSCSESVWQLSPCLLYMAGSGLTWFLPYLWPCLSPASAAFPCLRKRRIKNGVVRENMKLIKRERPYCFLDCKLYYFIELIASLFDLQSQILVFG